MTYILTTKGHRLILVNNDIYLVNEEIGIRRFDGSICSLGKYNTEQRAKEIFNEICNVIKNDKGYYEMPQE